MKERPILFSGAMVRALLNGTKTQTRRVVKQEEPDGANGCLWLDIGGVHTFSWVVGNDEDIHPSAQQFACPYGQPGDRIFVRECWKYAGFNEDGFPIVRYSADGAEILQGNIPSEEWSDKLQDIWAGLSTPENYGIEGAASDRRWRPSIHMPRWASRITLEITDVRVERLQDISVADAIAEGIEATMPNPGHWNWKDYLDDGIQTHAVLSYKTLWESINGQGSWDANPWVWAITFKRLQ